MPRWGLSMTHGTVGDWLVAEGIEVAAGDELLEVETEKIVGGVESPVAGILRRHLARPGQQIPVGGLVGVVAEPDVGDDEIDRFVEEFIAIQTVDESDQVSSRPEFVDVGTRQMRYLKRGEGGLPAVLIHGFTGNLNNWLFNHEAIAAYRTVYALDLPGHGRSSKDVGDGSLETLAEIVMEWMDVIDLSAAHLVGHSLGGAIALAIALRDPERVLSCSLLASAGLGPEINTDYIDGVVAADRRKQLKPYLELLFADAAQVTRQMVDDVVKFKRIDGVNAALTQIASCLQADGSQAVDLRDIVASLTCPILTVWGEDDQIIPASHGEGLPQSVAMHLLPDCGHMVQMEAASQVNQRIVKFLESVG